MTGAGTITRDEALLLGAVDRARLAPSVHNTQPWAFRFRDGTLELHADADRKLTAIDGEGRELILSCGAALLHLRVALEAAGVQALIATFPFPDRPEVIATVAVTGIIAPDPAAIELDRAADRRQTNRRSFIGTVDATITEALETAATTEGAGLQPISDNDDKTVVKVWQQEADQTQLTDVSYRTELHQWVGVQRAEDGIPLAATAQLTREAHDYAARNFAGASAGGVLEGDDDLATAVFLLFTEGDTPLDWLRAGQALGRVWLEATRLGLVLQPLSQSVEDPVVRLHLRRDLRLLTCWPQLLLRVGHAEAQPRTPRRPLSDVVSGG